VTVRTGLDVVFEMYVVDEDEDGVFPTEEYYEESKWTQHLPTSPSPTHLLYSKLEPQGTNLEPPRSLSSK
jgi:hypothetical protein